MATYKEVVPYNNPTDATFAPLGIRSYDEIFKIAKKPQGTHVTNLHILQ